MSFVRLALPALVITGSGLLLGFAPACGNDDQPSGATSSGSGGAGGAPLDCPPCVTDQDCASGSRCGQLGGDTYCAPDCTMGGASVCASGRACTPSTTVDGSQVSLCVPLTSQTCGVMTSASSSSTSSGSSEMCGSLLGPDLASCCAACKSGGGMMCQPNGCYGGWWCNKDSCKCQPPPAPSMCGSSSSSSSSTSSGGGASNVGPNGGTQDSLSFAIVGDTRPPLDDQTSAYPKAIIGQIWQDIENLNPRPGFAVSTGDYQFSKAFGNQAAVQIGFYLDARKVFSNVLFPALGNHECTGATASNCGNGNADGLTNNYKSFLSLMLGPINQTKPYYVIDVNSTTNAWTSKLVFIAANAWDSAQSSWLDGAMSKPTTYTFVIRHESSSANTAPGVTPSDQILAKYPYTMLIVGHTHTYYFNKKREVVVGNGGAPLTGGVNYGYVVARQRPDNAIEFKEYDYSTNLIQDTFAVKPDGSNTP